VSEISRDDFIKTVPSRKLFNETFLSQVFQTIPNFFSHNVWYRMSNFFQADHPVRVFDAVSQ